MNTEAALVSARSASFWIDVFGGRVPRARREVRVRGRRRSCGDSSQYGNLTCYRRHFLSSRLRE